MLTTRNTATAYSVFLSSSLGAVVGVSVTAAVFIVIVASTVVVYKVSRKNVMLFGSDRYVQKWLIVHLRASLSTNTSCSSKSFLNRQSLSSVDRPKSSGQCTCTQSLSEVYANGLSHRNRYI